MKKFILKGNMPQDAVFYSVSYEDESIVFSVIDNFKGQTEKVAIKSEDELIEKLLTTKYHDDVDQIEHITERFNKCSSYFLEALGVSGTDICIHYEQRLKQVNNGL